MKIIVYDDNLGFGGHQAMALQGVEALAEDASNRIFFMLNPKNEKLAEAVATIDNCQIVESPCASGWPQSLRNLVAFLGIGKLATLFKALGADLILCIQGDIEQSSQAVLAASQAGIDCISYLALPHGMTAMGASLGKLRDRLNQRLINLPSRYIAISEAMAGLLREQGIQRPVTVVRNGIAEPPKTFEHPASSIFTVGLVGRVEFKQKRQDFMVRAFCDFPEHFANCRLLMVGDGPDRTALAQRIFKCRRRSDIELQPWQEDIDSFFSTMDLLVIPSRYEGVPMVMLEALARGIPVIGSDRDGMRDILPRNWTFETDNPAAMAETFSRVRDTWPKEIKTVREKVLSEHALEAFKANFHEAVLGS